ncbi:MAG: formimidoylglutamase [Taibaiella sp.]|nr:formimidoylglutamase [Taibaiella sp.]
MNDLNIFLEEQHFIDTKPEGSYEPMQMGAKIMCFGKPDFNAEEADIFLLGCAEWSGVEKGRPYGKGPERVREELYRMYYWHSDIRIADLGNIRQGASPADTRSALLEVLHEIKLAGKIALVIGGGHDLMLQQYEAFKKSEQMVVASVADMLIDLDETEEVNASGFLLDMLTRSPNFVSHYSHIGFQSYYAHPQMLETLDKLRFDFYRLGKVREHIEDIEPVLRISDIFGLDMSVVRYSDAPANVNGSPNGLSGEEVCTLTRYAGMSDALTSFGIYGYDENNDVHNMTARQMAQMVWYFIDGCLVRRQEARLTDRDEFVVFNVVFSDMDTTFLRSKRTNRWWMRLPEGTFVPCSRKDYDIACAGDIPERWLREQERLA